MTGLEDTTVTKTEFDGHKAEVVAYLGRVEGKTDGQTRQLDRIESTLGKGSDDSTGTDGSGVAGQVAKLVRERSFIGYVLRVAGMIIGAVMTVAGIVYWCATHISWKP